MRRLSLDQLRCFALARTPAAVLRHDKPLHRGFREVAAAIEADADHCSAPAAAG